MKKVEKNKVEGKYLMVGVEKNIWYGSISVESREEILEKILPEYVGLKRVREAVAKLKKAENKKPNQEVFVSWRDGKTYSICEVDGKPTLVEVATTVEEVKSQIVSIVSEYIQADELDEFLAKYLEAVAEYTIFVDEVQKISEKLIQAVEELKSNVAFCDEKRAVACIDMCLTICKKITPSSYDSAQQICDAICSIEKMLHNLSEPNKGMFKENELDALAKFIPQIEDAVTKITLGKNKSLKIHRCIDSMKSYIKFIVVCPEYIPDGFAYLDGDVRKHNFRIIKTSPYSEFEKKLEFVMTWISARKLSDGTNVEGFYVSYDLRLNVHTKYDCGRCVESTSDIKKNSKRLCFNDNLGYINEQLHLISGDQYVSIIEWNREVGKNIIDTYDGFVIKLHDNNKLEFKKYCPEEGLSITSFYTHIYDNPCNNYALYVVI